MSAFTDRDFGRLEAEVVALKAQNARLEANQERMNEKLDLLVTAVTEAKGGWKMLLAIGGAAAATGAVVTKMILWFKGA
jgi:prefoldin subunit 5